MAERDAVGSGRASERDSGLLGPCGSLRRTPPSLDPSLDGTAEAVGGGDSGGGEGEGAAAAATAGALETFAAGLEGGLHSGALFGCVARRCREKRASVNLPAVGRSRSQRR